MSARLDEENKLIDRLADCIRFLGCGDEDGMEPGRYDELIEFAHDQQGEGWYLSCGEYPEEGAVFVGPLEYGALVVARAIVAEERAALAEGALAAQLTIRTDVAFQARLMAAGNAEHLSEHLTALGDQPVLIFHAEVPEVRKVGPLLRKLVSLTALEVGE